jgi:hypothetical protein
VVVRERATDHPGFDTVECLFERLVGAGEELL